MREVPLHVLVLPGVVTAGGGVEEAAEALAPGVLAALQVRPQVGLAQRVPGPGGQVRHLRGPVTGPPGDLGVALPLDDRVPQHALGVLRQDGEGTAQHGAFGQVEPGVDGQAREPGDALLGAADVVDEGGVRVTEPFAAAAARPHGGGLVDEHQQPVPPGTARVDPPVHLLPGQREGLRGELVGGGLSADAQPCVADDGREVTATQFLGRRVGGRCAGPYPLGESGVGQLVVDGLLVRLGHGGPPGHVDGSGGTGLPMVGHKLLPRKVFPLVTPLPDKG